MVRVNNKSKFKKSLRDAQPPVLRNPYVEPARPDATLYKKGEDACKELAAGDKVIRDQAVEDVGRMLHWLETSEHDKDVPEEFAKLWRGLFYCMWHSDKPLVQHDCAQKISELVHNLTSWELQATWFGAAWKTLHSEWGGLDKWRLDKFLTLMRKLLNRHFAMVAAVSEKHSDDDDYDMIIHNFCFPLLNTYGGGLDGIGRHISDIIVDEAIAVDLNSEVFTDIFHQLILPVLCTSSKSHCQRVYEYVWVRLLGGMKETEEALEWLADVEWDIIIESLQAAAIDEDTHDQNRAMLSRMNEEIDAFVGKADQHEEYVEIDSEEEEMDTRAGFKDSIELTRRVEVDSKSRRVTDAKTRRAVEKQITRLAASGDDKALQQFLKKQRQQGVYLPKYSKKKGRAGLSKALDSSTELRKQKKVKRKRRV